MTFFLDESLDYIKFERDDFKTVKVGVNGLIDHINQKY